jgi:hypothetical protein
VAARRATGPDGREWEVNVRRFRLPAWRDSGYEPEDDAHDLVSGAIAYVVLAPVHWFLVPLAIMLVELPAAVARSLFSSDRWIEATCRWPSELSILWRTSKEHARAAADEVARQLGEGYELKPEGAVFVSMTKPPGVDHLDA